MLGVSHRTAAVDLRERLAFAEERLTALLHELRRRFPATEAALLCTCNRTELYVARPAHGVPTFDDLRALLAEAAAVSPEQLAAATIAREQHEAVGHLFRVCAGIDSMVLGEPQVLGQVKRAYDAANAAAAVGPTLHRVFQQAIGWAKQVRTTTGLGAGRTSVGSVATDFARTIFERFADKTIVGVGAGEMAKLALRHLCELNPRRLWLVNRTTARAQGLARVLGLGGAGREGGVRAWADLDELLVEADIVVTSTGASSPIITASRLGSLQRRRRSRPLFVLDLGVPRDVEAAASAVANVYLYNIDDLQQVIDASAAGRSAEVSRCEGLLTAAVERCLSEVQHQDIGQLVRELRARLTELGEAEVRRTLNKARQSPDALDMLLEEHTHRLINKVLHLPLSQIDRRNVDAPLGFYAAALRKLFALDSPVEQPVTDTEAAPREARSV